MRTSPLPGICSTTGSQCGKMEASIYSHSANGKKQETEQWLHHPILTSRIVMCRGIYKVIRGVKGKVTIQSYYLQDMIMSGVSHKFSFVKCDVLLTSMFKV